MYGAYVDCLIELFNMGPIVLKVGEKSKVLGQHVFKMYLGYKCVRSAVGVVYPGVLFAHPHRVAVGYSTVSAGLGHW